MMSVPGAGLALLAGMRVLMALFWWIHLRKANDAIVDLGWTLGIGLGSLFLGGIEPASVRSSSDRDGDRGALEPAPQDPSRALSLAWC